MKGIILYKSKYGATKKYADWISEETGFESVEIKQADIDKVEEYDTIILGGGIYASGISGLSFLIKNKNRLKNKKIIIFCDGASPYDECVFQQIIDHNIKDRLEDVPCFYCRGSWDINKMSFIDRNLCKMLKKSIENKDRSELKVWEKELLEAAIEKCDWTDKKYIWPIIKEINR